MGKEAEPSSELGNYHEIIQKEDTTDSEHRHRLRRARSRSCRARKAIRDAPTPRSATTSREESASRSRDVAAESIIVPELKALPPISIPEHIQRPVLRTLQYNLEAAFFEYAQKYYPNFLVSNNWTCAQAAALDVWTAEFHKACTNGEISLGTRDLHAIKMVFRDLDELCETSVKGIPLAGDRLSELTASAAYAMKYLGDYHRASKVNEISLALVTACTDDISNNFTRIVNEVGAAEKRIAYERRKLERFEKKARLKSDTEMKELVERLEECLRHEIGGLGILGRGAR